MNEDVRKLAELVLMKGETVLPVRDQRILHHVAERTRINPQPDNRYEHLPDCR